jgi:hypothetical protein
VVSGWAAAVALLIVGVATVAVGSGVFRIELNDLAVAGDGAVVVALVSIGIAALIVGGRAVWITLN